MDLNVFKEWLSLQRWSLTRRQRRLVRGALTGLAVAVIVLLVRWAGWFSSSRLSASDYLYATDQDPGDEIVIVAIDEPSLQALGDWPWPFAPYVELFARLDQADIVGLDVMLTSPGPEGHPDALALVEVVRRSGNVILPLASFQLFRPESTGELYTMGQIVRPFPDLVEAAAGAGAVSVVLDADNQIRRVPLLSSAEGGEVVEAFSLRMLRRRLGVGEVPAVLSDRQVVLGDEDEIKYQVPTDENGAMLVNFVGAPNSFPAYSFIDVIQGRMDGEVFAGKIVLVGMMNAVGEMDVHQTPVSAARMSGIEFQANALYTLLNHRALTPAAPWQTVVLVVVLALLSALALSQLGALPGAGFTLFLALAYFFFTNWQFDRGHLPSVLFPYATVILCYVTVTAVHFAGERIERNRVADVFGRFVSDKVRDQIVNMALDDPEMVQPGGRLMEISVLFADIRGFTTLSENLSPPEVVEILNLYLNSMEEQVFKHGGTLDKYTGDGMMVLFGAPLEQPDHALRAVRAALDMQRAAAEVSGRRGEVEWQVAYGIGITTGPAVVGQIGSHRRLDYTAIGDTVNLSARLEGKAPPGAIWISEATYGAVKDAVVAEKLEPMTVKGKARPVTVYAVREAAPAVVPVAQEDGGI